MIALDLDGTAAYYEKGQFPKIGEPIESTWKKVFARMKEGEEFVIFTARVYNNPEQVAAVKQWLADSFLPAIEVTNEKTPEMTEFWDDRAVAFIPNKGVMR